MNKILNTILGVTLGVFLGAGVASATLLGTHVDVGVVDVVASGDPPTVLIGPDNVLVQDPVVELPGFGGGLVDIDIGDNFFRLDFLGAFGPVPADFFAGVMFSFDGLTMLGLAGGDTNIAGFGGDRVLFDSTHLAFNLQGLTLAAGDFVEVTGRFAAIPNPATWLLLVGGFLALAVFRRQFSGAPAA